MHTMCGCLASSRTLILSSRMFKNLQRLFRQLNEGAICNALVHGFQNTSDRKVIFQLDSDLLVRKRFENREDELEEDSAAIRTCLEQEYHGS